MKITELFDVLDLAEEIQRDYVMVKRHPTLPLRIFNYTKSAQYEQRWNDVTINCRGLIVDDDDNIVAFPFKKFYNYNYTVFDIDTSGPVEVYDKLDGSLGIVCFYDGELVVATRGSFVSDMAQWAYKHIEKNYYETFKSVCFPGYTALVEIIYPENRIVLDYKGMQDVVLLGLYDAERNWISPSKLPDWPGPRAQVFDAQTFSEALALPPRENAEGVVVYFKNTGERLKIKQQDYVELHKDIFSINRLTVWRKIMNNELGKFINSIPDEFDEYVRNVAEELANEVRAKLFRAAKDWVHTKVEYPKNSQEFYEISSRVGDAHKINLIETKQLEKLNESVWRSVRPFGNGK